MRRKRPSLKPLWALSADFSDQRILGKLNIFGLERIRHMLIVDGQIHLWEKGTPSPPHRQEPYLAEQAIAAMDQAGVDRALIHPVLWDPDFERIGHRSGAEIPRPLRHHGVVLSRRPEWSRPRRALERAAGHARPALLFQRAAQTGVDDRRELDWLWPAAEQAGVPVALAAALFLPTVGQIAERHPGLKLIVDHMAVPPGAAASLPIASSPNCWRSPNTPTSRSRRPVSPATRKTRIRSAASMTTCIAASMRSGRTACSGAPTSRGCPVPGGNA